MAQTLAPNVFVTVGTTRFDGLFGVLFHSDDPGSPPQCLQLIANRGVKRLRIQYGNSAMPSLDGLHHDQIKSKGADGTLTFVVAGIEIEMYRLKSNIEEDMKWAGLVISHAGSGSILESLQLNKPLIVVVNDTLADNHQAELAFAVENQGHCIATDPRHLAKTLGDFNPSTLRPFVPVSSSLFSGIVNGLMGYVD
ncbi:glycosyltransferase family 1 protein [Gonapodya prolifera JEL478]|uniref:UDP-N-acetylglucosamine transferase subunit ALG13 n=1 Tax=Gonapodya prolifera (strain JEL478) TaxID=1344416 RepID=A0A139AP39_GONPJ|nr:glycosyltransferase family 1 protein [Gonapodya prolifera JEL478]|eukprot:KXS18414.1 glycosyltransferase family 1 protein [Gonapodya prolifera JEL478]